MNIQISSEVKTEKKYILECTENEAKIIRALVGNVAGGGEIRKVINSIYDSLEPIFPDDMFVKYFTGECISIKSGAALDNH